MTAITVDHKQGMARDHGEVQVGEDSDFQSIVVDISIEDEDRFCVDFSANTGENERRRILVYVPMDRIRKLLKDK